VPLSSMPITASLRLRTHSADSTNHVQATVAPSNTWVLVSGTVPANTNLDQVVLRLSRTSGPGGAFAYVDDVHVCKIAAGTGTGTGHGNGWFSDHGTLVLVLLGVGVILGGLGVGWRRYRRNVMATNNGAPSIGVADFDNDGNVDN